MKQLTESIQKLKLDPRFAISVKDNATGIEITKNHTGKMLVEKFGSVEAYFEDLNTKGLDSVKIINKKDNSNGWRTLDSYNMRFEEKAAETMPQSQPQPQNNAPMQQNHNNNQMQGLLGGLNMMDVSYKVQDHTRLMEDNNRLRVENEALKEKNTELKEKILEDRFDASKSKGNTDLFKELAPLLAPLLTKTMGGGAAAGLAAPVAQLPEMSHVKSSLIAMVHQMDDDFITDLIMISKGMQIEAFDDELTELIKKHNIQ